MQQEVSASTILKIVEILIIASLLVLLPGGNQVVRGNEPKATTSSESRVTFSPEQSFQNAQE